jgi:hypothetical protein
VTATADRTSTTTRSSAATRSPHRDCYGTADSTSTATRSGTNGIFDRNGNRDPHRIRHSTATAPRSSPASLDALCTARIQLPRVRVGVAHAPTAPRQPNRASVDITGTSRTGWRDLRVAPTVAGRPSLIRLVHRVLHESTQIPPGGTERGRPLDPSPTPVAPQGRRAGLPARLNEERTKSRMDRAVGGFHLSSFATHPVEVTSRREFHLSRPAPIHEYKN